MTIKLPRPCLFLFASLLSLLTFGGVNAQAQTLESIGGTPLTITIKRGDTAYSISRSYGISLDLLMAYNNMVSPTLKVGQVLRLAPQTYTTQPGDTVYSIARQFGLNPKAILATNTMPRDVKLEVGQVIALPDPTPAPVAAVPEAPVQTVPEKPIPEKPVAKPAPVAAAPAPLKVTLSAPTASSKVNPAPGSWYANATALIGTPYALGSKSKKATDCSGFVLQVMTPLGIRLPRTSAEQARAGIAVSRSDLRAGDLVFFDTIGRGKVTHVGIYLGDGQFINANSYQGKVVVEDLWGNDYWVKRFTNARRVLVDAYANY